MKKLTISIPDNLTEEQEVFAIAQQLGGKLLTSGNNKRIGKSQDIKHLETQITVRRKCVEKQTITLTCPICQTLFDQKAGTSLWTNYGGSQKRLRYCGDSCSELVLSSSGVGRVSPTRAGLRLPFSRISN